MRTQKTGCFALLTLVLGVCTPTLGHGTDQQSVFIIETSDRSIGMTIYVVPGDQIRITTGYSPATSSIGAEMEVGVSIQFPISRNHERTLYRTYGVT